MGLVSSSTYTLPDTRPRRDPLPRRERDRCQTCARGGAPTRHPSMYQPASGNGCREDHALPSRADRETFDTIFAPPEQRACVCSYTTTRASHLQAPQGARMAGRKAALPCALYTDLLLMAQSGRALVWPCHTSGNPPRLFCQRQTTRRLHRRVCAPLQSSSNALLLDGHR